MEDQYDPVQGFEFVTAHRAVHQVATMCRVLGVSPSGYYAWRKRPLSTRARTDVELTAHIDAIHHLSRGTYGAPRIHAELAARGLHVADARLAVFDFIEGWYNPKRRHSALDYLSPMIYERLHWTSDRTVPSGSTIDTGSAIALRNACKSGAPACRRLSPEPTVWPTSFVGKLGNAHHERNIAVRFEPW